MTAGLFTHGEKVQKHKKMENYYLITTDNWFYGPNGKTYRAVWGKVAILQDDFLGIKTNRNSTNWYARVGSKEKHVIIAGCQIHYAVAMKDRPSEESVQDYSISNEKGVVKYIRPSQIYIAE